MSCSTNLFGNKSQYIKTYNGDIVAVEGSITTEKLMLSDLRIPYKQLLKSRVILKAGQVNYLLNHLGLGNDATFLLIKAVYNAKSTIESDNYICWSYTDNISKINYMDDVMLLTGNSSHRIPELYLTNPNLKYDVILDVMVAVIDTTYAASESPIQSGVFFTGLEYTDIENYVVGESVVINDKSTPSKPLLYLILNNISNITRQTDILILNDIKNGIIMLKFLSEYDAQQAHSLFNYLINNPSTIIDTLVPLYDNISPIMYFNSNVGNTASGDYIYFNGSSASVPYDTSFGNTFSTTIQLGTYSIITKSMLSNLLINNIIDNRDGTMSVSNSNLIISGTNGSIDAITNSGTYSLTFDITDIAYNNLDNFIMQININ